MHNKALIFAKTHHNLTLEYIPKKTFIPSPELKTFALKVKMFIQYMESLINAQQNNIWGRSYKELLS